MHVQINYFSLKKSLLSLSLKGFSINLKIKNKILCFGSFYDYNPRVQLHLSYLFMDINLFQLMKHLGMCIRILIHNNSNILCIRLSLSKQGSINI